MKTCVFIIGTNAVGKTTLAKELIRRCGGVLREEGRSTVCADGRTVFAGRYAGVKHGGVDGLNETRCLADMAREAFRQHEVFICEGSYMNTFGINLTNALFTADRHLVVFLYAPIAEIDKRLKTRTIGGGHQRHYRTQAAPGPRFLKEVGRDRRSRPLVQHRIRVPQPYRGCRLRQN